jgi:hypothetical protein
LFIKFIYIMMRGEPRVEAPKAAVASKAAVRAAVAVDRDKDSHSMPGILIDPTTNTPIQMDIHPDEFHDQR